MDGQRLPRGVRPRFGAAPCAIVLMLVAALGIPASGCSYVFVHGPPPDEQRPSIIDCTSSNAAPIIDMLVAAWQMIRILYALGASDSAYAMAPISRDADIGIGLGMLTLFGTSAGYGFSQTGRCREVLAEDNYRPVPRPRPRPQTIGQPPERRLGPPPPAPERKQEEQEEEAAVQARVAERARAAREAARATPDGGAAPENPAGVPTVTVQPPPPVPQHADPE